MNAPGPKQLSQGDANTLSQRNQTESRLLRLPGELRNKIYAYVFRLDYIRAHGYWSKDWMNPRMLMYFVPPWPSTFRLAGLRLDATALPHLLYLTTACRQIQAETALLPFNLNTFEVPLERLQQFLDKLPLEIKDCVRILRIQLPGTMWDMDEYPFNPDAQDDRELFSYLAALKQLDQLEKVCIRPWDDDDEVPEEGRLLVEKMVRNYTERDIVLVVGV